MRKENMQIVDEISVFQIRFQKVCEIEPDVDEDKKIKEYNPQSEYINCKNLPLHEFGDGSFCRFRIPSCWKGKAGVYLIYVDNTPKYVGECDDLEKRYNIGYGTISPRNCFLGGQTTNCRINKEILSNKKKGSKITLFFTETDRRFEMERDLISKTKPEWNRTSGKKSSNRTKITHKTEKTTTASGKYYPLEKYLSEIEAKKLQLSFAEIESILGFALPSSAYKYSEWWSNGSHTHANAWLNSDRTVSEYKLGDYVVFTRKISIDIYRKNYY